MSESTTHLAGPAITICGRVIQRCAICGEKLVDSLNCAMPLKPDGTADTIGTWEPGRLVRVEAGNPAHWILLEDPEDMRLPADACIDLVE